MTSLGSMKAFSTLAVSLALCALAPAVAAAGLPANRKAAPLPRATPARAPVGAKVFLTVEEALGLAFGKARVERTTAYLDEAQEARASKLAGFKVKTRVVHLYTARDKTGSVLGVAYFDTHVVRSKRETLMVVVAPDQSVRRVEMLAFAEPPKYIPHGAFYGQLKGKRLNNRLALGRSIRSVSGATLTSQATVKGVRRVLALHLILSEDQADSEAASAGEAARVQS